jgi:hypothetical protein
VGGIFCDLSKAFDRVNHDNLLSKMEFYGIKGTVHKLIKYLSGRYQRVILYKNGSKCCSAWKEIQCGVPQGSVLGLLLFLLYINDTNILIFDKNPMNFKCKTNRLFFKINEWFERNLLVINYEKLCFTQFRNKNSKSLDIQVEYSNRRIPSTSDISFLGIKADKSFTWGMHIEA